ncbi:MAG: AI-2E family transporter, partial [Steroidobacteraceae bacterium]
MDSPVSQVPDSSPLASRERALGIIATASVLALLYFARGVLVPITLAMILSLLIAPLVRVLRRLRLGQTLSVLAAVLMLALSFAAVAGVIGSQLMRMAQSLPRYERTIERKLKTLNDVTVGKFNALTGQAGRFIYRRATDDEPEPEERTRAPQQRAIPRESAAPRESKQQSSAAAGGGTS